MKMMWLDKNYDLKNKRTIDDFHYLSLDLKSAIESMLLKCDNVADKYSDKIIKSITESYILKIVNNLELDDYNAKVDAKHLVENVEGVINKIGVTTLVNIKFIDNASQKVYKFNITLYNSYYKRNNETRLLDGYYNVTEL